MNDHTPHDDLPELSDAAASRIEAAVFGEIAARRPRPTPAAARARARRRGSLTGTGVAAAFVVGVLVTPPILGIVGGTASSTADGGGMPPGVAVDTSRSGSVDQSASDAAPESTGVAPAADDAVDREIIATASATLEVKDIADAGAAIAALAEKHGGYVESTEIGKSEATDDTSAPAPVDPGYGWVSIRVPSADLTTVVDELAETGDVLTSSISKQDVTSEAIDLRARVDATSASVQRLTELMAQTGTVAELIEAEVALTDRQAQLESYQQQLTALEDQVSMSTLQVQLTRTAPATTADPAGFADGLFAGWNGLVVSLNALVIALGFVLPWLALGAVVLLAIWLIRRARRARRTVGVPAAEEFSE